MFTWYGDPIYRYKNNVDGRWASTQAVWDWGDKSATQAANNTASLVERLANQTITLETWHQEMRDRIRDEYLRQYFLGVGGRDRMTSTDWGSIGGMLREQYSFLDGFAAQIQAGELSAAEIARRSKMYLVSSREAFERASTRTRGLPAMPAYPGDGSSCLGLTNCGCHWDYRKRGASWHCTWVMDLSKNNCELCIGHASDWSPLVIEI